MKANNTPRRENHDTGEIGIGTMIVFIAAVIVAAIAAAVLVNTAGNLQRKAQETGEETTSEVSGNIFVRDIVGNVTTISSTDYVSGVNMTVALAPGANDVDLTQLHIRWQDDDNLAELSHSGHGDGNFSIGDDPYDPTVNDSCTQFDDGFCVINVNEEEGGSGDNVLQPGDVVHIYVGLDDASTDEPLPTRTDVSIRMMPEEGSPTETGFSTPASYSGEDFVFLK